MDFLDAYNMIVVVFTAVQYTVEVSTRRKFRFGPAVRLTYTQGQYEQFYSVFTRVVGRGPRKSAYTLVHLRNTPYVCAGQKFRGVVFFCDRGGFLIKSLCDTLTASTPGRLTRGVYVDFIAHSLGS